MVPHVQLSTHFGLVVSEIKQNIFFPFIANFLVD
jgi:hypothetical protein